MVATAAAAPASNMSNICQQFGPHDALLVLNVQNSFMEERPVRIGQQPEYALPANWTASGMIPAGTLPVVGSMGIIDVVNDWIDFAQYGSIFSTLDYHPPLHCSFCDIMDSGIAGGKYCLRGIGTDAEAIYQATFNTSHICQDPVSQMDYLSAAYFQWPPHGVAASSGARLDPYVRLPNRSVVVKLGTNINRDDYDAFAVSARVSIAPPNMHDVQPSAQSHLGPPSQSLTTELQSAGAKRLFLMGLATDYVVKRTAYHALDDQNNWTVVLVSAATRGIVPGATAEVLDTVRARHNGHVLAGAVPSDAMIELCAGTCDAETYKMQCADGEYCAGMDNFPWGMCTSCNCRNGGVCMADGMCQCAFPYSGADCSGGWEVGAFALLVVVLVLLLCLISLFPSRRGYFYLRQWWHERLKAKQREKDEAEAKLEQMRCEKEANRGECTFWFVNASKLLESNDKSLPAFKELRKREGFLKEIKITKNAAYRVRYMNKYLCVSHRWFAKDAPDKDGLQLKTIKKHLRKNRHIQWVWFDFWCMPQGERTLAQKAAFNHMLTNINWLYLGCSVLVLLDLSYLSRFWTQFEAWLSFQVTSTEGLMGVVHAHSSKGLRDLNPSSPERSSSSSRTATGEGQDTGGGDGAPRERCTVEPIYNANRVMASYLRAMWSEKTPQEAHAILAQEDVTVTSMKDKEAQLPKILKLHEDIREVMSLDEATEGERSASSPSHHPADDASSAMAPDLKVVMDRAVAEAQLQKAKSTFKEEMERVEALKAKAEATRLEVEKLEEGLKAKREHVVDVPAADELQA